MLLPLLLPPRSLNNTGRLSVGMPSVGGLLWLPCGYAACCSLVLPPTLPTATPLAARAWVAWWRAGQPPWWGLLLWRQAFWLAAGPCRQQSLLWMLRVPGWLLMWHHRLLMRHCRLQACIA